jgi:hypothetical protein
MLLLVVLFVLSIIVANFLVYFVFKKMGGGRQFRWYKECEVTHDLVWMVRIYRSLLSLAILLFIAILVAR